MVELIINISNNKILNMDEFRAASRQLKNGKHLLTVKDLRKRSIHQNAYYWGIIVPMVRKGLYESGYDDVRTNDDAHAILKHLFLKKEVANKQTGEMITMAGSSAILSIPEFNEFIEMVCRWASEYLGIVIPAPYEPLIELEKYSENLMDQIID